MIADDLFQNGILQLGMFATPHGMRSYRLRLELLPAYPQLIAPIVDRIRRTLQGRLPRYERLVADADSSVIGGIIAHQLDVPLVYSRGRGDAPAIDLAGAYDVGHPAVLIVNAITPNTEAFIAGCVRVGLDIHTVVPIIGTVHTIDHINSHPVFHLYDIVSHLQQAGEISEDQRQTIMNER